MALTHRFKQRHPQMQQIEVMRRRSKVMIITKAIISQVSIPIKTASALLLLSVEVVM